MLKYLSVLNVVASGGLMKLSNKTRPFSGFCGTTGIDKLLLFLYSSFVLSPKKVCVFFKLQNFYTVLWTSCSEL